jgi:hypothetical protein
MALEMIPTISLPHPLLQRERAATDEVEQAGDEVGRAIARAARRWPGLHSSLRHAEIIAREEGVYQPPPAPHALALVKPATNLVFHLVRLSATGLACTCDGWPPTACAGPGDGLFCAHILAYLLALYLEQPLSPLPYSPEQLWELTLQELRLQMTGASFNQWLLGSAVVLEASSPLSLSVAVRNLYAQEWLNHRLHSLIVRTITSVAGYGVQVRFSASQYYTKQFLNGSVSRVNVRHSPFFPDEPALQET